MQRVGLIVNPVAGLGGRVGLKGSDDPDIQRLAIELGAIPQSSERAALALKSLVPLSDDLEIITYPRKMGETAVRQVGFIPQVIGNLSSDQTTANDTMQAVKDMLQEGISLLLFAGGDGTARDVYDAGGMEIPSLGIPAGVKIHSAVYSIHPRAAGELAIVYLSGKAGLVQAEVMDLDEEAYRQGHVSPRLYGYLKVPYQKRYIQGAKVPSTFPSTASLAGIAEDLAERMKPSTLFIIGPGSSTYEVAKHLGVEKSLLGVDAYLDGRLLARDTNETSLLHLLDTYPTAEIIVTPIGGQGCIFGRGNQPISPEVIRRVGKAHILIVSTPEKINALAARPLWVDTGEADVDQMLCGYYQVITGYKEYLIYKITA